VTGCNCSGGMAEYFVADCSQWHILPDAVTWEEAALIEPYTIGAQICARAEVKSGDVVLIYGGGPIGLIAGNTAKNLGATVILSEILDKRLSLAREIGMDYVIDVKTENVRQRVQEITCFRGPNVVFDCAGLPSMISEAIELLSPAGRLVPVAGGTFAVDGYQMLIKQLAIVGSRLQNKQFKRVVDKFADYKANVARMITDRFPFQDADKAFEYANEHRPETGKIVLLFD
jgi:threonine dehydrogenase-like Zn-dependent dehydrogenase